MFNLIFCLMVNLFNNVDLFKKNNTNNDLTIVIDGVFFQINQTGIARVWLSLLKEWQLSGFIRHIVFLDRAHTAPKLEGIQCHSFSAYGFHEAALECERLQQVCDEVQADLFISTYYTTPILTPSIMMVHDMIPEAIGLDLTELCWREKHFSILHASKYITVSQNTAYDLIRFYPRIAPNLVHVINNGVDADFFPEGIEKIQFFIKKFNIQFPYFLVVGSRLSLKNYKNIILFFKALKHNNIQDIAIVCVGGGTDLEPELRSLITDIPVYLLSLTEEDLRSAYSGAIALIYPSLYEGFGLPIVEAMACGCPVITCRNSSLPEVAGDAALYVDEYDVNEMVAALKQVQMPEVRQKMIEAGLKQAQKFSWSKMANAIAELCLTTIEELKQNPNRNAQTYLIWQEFRRLQIEQQQQANLAEQKNQALEAKVNQLEQQYQESLSIIESLNQKIINLSQLNLVSKKVLKHLIRQLGLNPRKVKIISKRYIKKIATNLQKKVP